MGCNLVMEHFAVSITGWVRRYRQLEGEFYADHLTNPNKLVVDFDDWRTNMDQILRKVTLFEQNKKTYLLL
eukprot:UN15938